MACRFVPQFALPVDIRLGKQMQSDATVASITSGQKERPRGERRPYERPVTLRRNQRWNQQSHKAARFISSDIKAQNVELRFSGSFALHPQIRPAMLSSKRSATQTSTKSFD